MGNTNRQGGDGRLNAWRRNDNLAILKDVGHELGRKQKGSMMFGCFANDRD
jgi:hypothetical protein